MAHLIVNVGRQIGSGGREIARWIADEFHCEYYDRELLNLAAQESGFSKELFERNDEHKGFLKTLFNIHTPLTGEHNFYRSPMSDESLFQFQADAIRKAADKGNCVFLGRCADYILRDYKNTLNIFISADLRSRIEAVMKRNACSEEEAKKLIQKGESERASYYNYYTGKQWGHSESYDLCINISVLGEEDTKQLLTEFIRKKQEKL